MTIMKTNAPINQRPQTAEPTLDQLLAARRKQIDDAINEMISVADAFFLELPAQILNGVDDLPMNAFGQEGPEELGEFNRFEGYFQRWLSALEPGSDETQRRLKRGEDKIEDILQGRMHPDFPPESPCCRMNPDVRVAMNQLCDGVGHLAFAAQNVGYVFGLMVGARFAGATRERMVEIASGCRRRGLKGGSDENG